MRRTTACLFRLGAASVSRRALYRYGRSNTRAVVSQRFYGDYNAGHHDHGDPIPNVDVENIEFPKYDFDLGESTCWEKKDDKVYINSITGEPERWIDVNELFTEEYWDDPDNWDAHDYAWKCKVELLQNRLGITAADAKDFRAKYDLSQGSTHLEWACTSPTWVHTFEEPVVGKDNPYEHEHH
eukprot:TRINITY_DN541_c0_g1_i2.p1 TRINITY_DN541_c0_g1~~TRINITY_DN541_c0_g1_i2.p1  ORF type:complete len:193 (-),score=27.07 TRINITY_DN541_c0_g1_i2:36-584(-)